jgi:hypothetical protein
MEMRTAKHKQFMYWYSLFLEVEWTLLSLSHKDDHPTVHSIFHKEALCVEWCSWWRPFFVINLTWMVKIEQTNLLLLNCSFRNKSCGLKLHQARPNYTDHSASEAMDQSSQPFLNFTMKHSFSMFFHKVKCYVSTNFQNDDKIVQYVLPLVGLYHILHTLVVIWVFEEVWSFGFLKKCAHNQ